MEEGKAAYVLPRYKNAPYVTIEESDTFGLIDIVFRNLQMESGNQLELEGARGNLMKRKFTVQTVKNSIIHQLSIDDLKRLQFEYPEVYDELFFEQSELLEEILTSKMEAIQFLEG